MFTHNLKIAIRNLLKYKLQTLISVLSIAIGIVVLSAVHSAITYLQLPAITNEPYYDRAVNIAFDSIDNRYGLFKLEYVRALMANGGLRSTDGTMTAPSGDFRYDNVTFHLGDTIERTLMVEHNLIEPSYLNWAGYRSALTGKKIRKLKEYECVISENMAQKLFGDRNPVGASYDWIEGTNECIQAVRRDHPVRIVDVYTQPALTEFMSPDMLLTCMGDFNEIHNYFSAHVCTTLKPGATLTQLQREVDERLKPFGVKGRILLVKDHYQECSMA